MILKLNFKKILGISAILIMLLICFYPCAVVSAEYVESSLITVVYLEQIEGTYFARNVIQKVRVPVKGNHRIDIKDVANKLGNQVYGCLNSYCGRFKYYPEGDFYKADYENSVYLNAKTTDGKFAHYFLDLNKSFYEYYAQFVKSSDRKKLHELYVSDDVYGQEYNPLRDRILSLLSAEYLELIAPFLENLPDDFYYCIPDYFFDIDEFYRQIIFTVYVNEAITVQSYTQVLTVDLFSLYWNGVQKKNPQLNGMKPTEIYGYWGFVPIPHSNSINDLLQTELFGFDTTFNGVLEQFPYAADLEKEAYQYLLDEYGYSWLSKAWATVVDWAKGGSNADFYMFYASGEVNKAFIAENGATNINDNRTGTVIKSEETVKDVIGNIKDVFSGEKLKKTLAIVIGVVVGVILLLIVLKVLSLISSKKG